MSRSLKLIITFRNKSIRDDTYYKMYTNSFFEKLNEFFQDETYEVDVTKPRSIDLDNIYKAQLFEIEVILKFSVQKTYREVCAKIIQDWSNPDINKLSKLWLRIADPLIIENNGKLNHSDIQLKEIAFGTFPDMQYFMRHYHYESKSDERELTATFYHSQRKVSLFTFFNHDPECQKNPVHNKFEFNYSSIFEVVVNYVSEFDLVEVYFHLYHTPLLFVEKKGRNEEVNNDVLASDQEYQSKYWDRVLEFGCSCRKFQCSIKRVGRCPVFKIIIPKKHKTYDIIERLMHRCSTNTLFHFAAVKSLYPKAIKSLVDFETFPFNTRLLNSIFDKSNQDDIKFKCQYSWEVVNGKSWEIRDQILLKYEKVSSVEHWEILKNKIKSYCTNPGVIDALIKSLYDISEMINKKSVFVFEDALDILFTHYQINESEFDDDVPEGMCLIRRVVLTPSKMICLQPSEHFDNRVIRNREYCPENFLRISIQDDNSQKLTFAVQYLDYHKKNYFLKQVVKNFLLEGIQIGPRKYKVLASSNSQLREHGIWMYAEDGSGNTAESIREWMGNFSHIKNVAKYMARMGQCFSASDESAQIKIKEEEVENEPDVCVITEGKEYNFSDGVGLISKELAGEVRESYARKNNLGPLDFSDLYDPSAFQIRFQGCKGMLAETRLYSERKIGIRDSMRKFQCHSSNDLEIVKISAPRAVFLNRPLITILENLGVEEGVFLNLQKKMVFDLTDSLIYENKACKLLQSCTSLDYPFKKFSKAGVSVTQEPFFRSLLLCVYKSLIGNLKRKARIAVPPEYGRNMLGIMDETGTLEYGQIFAQCSKEVTLIKSETKPLEFAGCCSTVDSLFQCCNCFMYSFLCGCILYPVLLFTATVGQE